MGTDCPRPEGTASNRLPRPPRGQVLSLSLVQNDQTWPLDRSGLLLATARTGVYVADWATVP